MARPSKFNTVEEIQNHIDEYFDELESEQPPTVTGLALWLDLTRQGLVEYGNKELFSDTIKKAKQRVERFNEEHLLRGKSPAGTIFNLKNNFNWKDKTEQEVNSVAKIMYVEVDKQETKDMNEHIEDVINEPKKLTQREIIESAALSDPFRGFKQKSEPA